MGLFKGHVDMALDVCQINVMTEEMLTQAVMTSDGILVVTSNRDIELTNSEKQHKRVIRMRPHLTIIGLTLWVVQFLM